MMEGPGRRCLRVFSGRTPSTYPLDLCLLMRFLGQRGDVYLEGTFLQLEGVFLQSQGAHSPS